MAPPWITSLSCSPLPSRQHLSPIQWLRFAALSPCPQHLLFSAVDALFLLSLVALVFTRLLRRRRKDRIPGDAQAPLLDKRRLTAKADLQFHLTLAVTVLESAAFLVLALVRIVRSEPQLHQTVFLLVHFLSLAAAAAAIADGKRSLAAVHPVALRCYWIASFLVAVLFAASAVVRIAGRLPAVPEDILSLILLPISLLLLLVAVAGSTGVSVVEDSPAAPVTDRSAAPPNVTPYASASLLSRMTWCWLNPIISKGYREPMQLEDVPSLAPEHRAERMHAIFESNWPRGATRSDKHPVIAALLRCFWPQILVTALLSVVRVIVMYVGPSLVNRFVDFASGKRSSLAEGYYLCAVLLSAKVLEVLVAHHYNFQSAKLGMMIRSALITSIYRKGLRLSCSARQAHGVGMIVNYMAVDAQQISDMVLQIHYIWIMPLEIGIAIVLLYTYLGPSVITSAVAIAVVMAVTSVLTHLNNNYQFGVMMMRDSRMKAVNEMLSYMRVIKFQAWEEHFDSRIQSFRQGEYGWLKKFLYSVSATMSLLWVSPNLVSLLAFGTCVLAGVKLTAGMVFTATSFFKTLEEPMRTFPQALISVSQALISLERLNAYMASSELDQSAVDRLAFDADRELAVEVRGGSFAWDDEGEPILRGLDVGIRRGELTAVVGTVGSGKSSFLSCVLGEMHKISGKVTVCGTTGYVAQTAWIQNRTIQENILFGQPMDPERYKEVVRVCCLEKDLEMMEFGDQTEIGERGINLSGGQKQRIQLARAVYQDSDIYLLDDVFSAVDAHTGSEIFKECVRGVLKEKTVVLVTHQVDFLHNVDLILVMREGKIVESGKYDELLGSGTDFGALVAAHDSSMELVEKSASSHESQNQKTKTSDSVIMVHENPNGDSGSVVTPKSKKGTSKLIDDEERETGRVGWQVYKLYITEAWGWWGVFMVIVISFLWQGSQMASDYWLAHETSEDAVANFSPSVFIQVYSYIIVASIFFATIRSFLVSYLGLVTAQRFFKQILASILHAPMSFFDTTPSGRILTRASTDQTNIDLFLPFFVGMAVSMYITVLGILIITCQVAWPSVIAVFPLAWMNLWYRGYYLATSRELTRLEAITKAPIIHHFSETILGVATIRSFGREDPFFLENLDRVNSSLRMDFHNNASNEWLGFRLELIGSSVLCISALLMVMLPSNFIKPEFVGLSLSYGLSLNTTLFWSVWISCFIENRMVSVERIKQFTNIASEAAWKIKDCLPPPNWPTKGEIDICDLKVRYRPNTPLILRGVTVNIRGGENVGVVGRTGSGKSTLIQALFRIVEPSEGRIVIDEVHISTLGLYDLRSRFGIIPQEPVLFEGTVRSNIDPLGLYSDEDIWQALERCQLKDSVTSKSEKLDALVVDSGDNWSVGQRQLLCLGRVMLKRSRILFMDEATASVDSQTDLVIQKIIREDFASCTIISIAHRIPTVMDCDRVLVVDAGVVKEFDSPQNLIERPTLFGALVQEYAHRSSDM